MTFKKSKPCLSLNRIIFVSLCVNKRLLLDYYYDHFTLTVHLPGWAFQHGLEAEFVRPSSKVIAPSTSKSDFL